jgi:hypothetical protein
MSEAPNTELEQRLMAYLDGELKEQERAQVESLIKTNPELDRLVAQWREQGELIRSLPKLRLDDGFADRVLAAVDKRESEHSTNAARKRNVALRPLDARVNTETNWRIGAVAIATLAAMLLLTLFVFPRSNEPPSVAVNANQGDVVKKTDDAELNSKTGSGGINPDAGQPNTTAAAGSPNGPSRPLLNKSLAGQNGKPNTQPRDLVVPLRLPEHSELADQVVWVDMKSRSTALADIEAVFVRNSITILRGASASDQKQGDQTLEATQGHLVQRSNSRFEALHVVATRSQVKRAIIELSSQHAAKFQAITPSAGPGFFDSERDPGANGISDSAQPNGNVPRHSRISGSPTGANGLNRPATVEQLQPVELISGQSDPNQPDAERAQALDTTEKRQLDEWFGLAEKEDESSYVRLLLLVDMSSEDSAVNPPSSDQQ